MPPAPARSALIALLVAACGSGEPAAPAPPPPTEPSCPAAAVDVPSEPGYPTAESLEEAAVALVRRDVAPSACLVRVSAQQGSVLVVASHEGATFRMRLDARLGVARESAAPHVAAQRLLEGLVEAGVEQAL